VVFERPHTLLTKRQFARHARAAGLELEPGTRMLYRGSNIFMNGEASRAARPALPLLRKLANERALTPPFAIPPAALGPLYDWYSAGYVRLARE
jgi:50S ribosomal protein L16 3-hydroxylase